EEKREEVPGKEDRAHWKLYGRSTPPLYAIFFDYDDFSIREDMWDRIKANVRYLMEKPNLKIELQGNCDERGTNEYNFALGMKRALEVKKVLVKLGIDENRINVISFGEEKPLCKESDESCWAINRRVDFVIK
ncbi:MAG: peptidoglycan-associated lipoprotein Pal, partial [Caldimicrobium sp.]